MNCDVRVAVHVVGILNSLMTGPEQTLPYFHISFLAPGKAL